MEEALRETLDDPAKLKEASDLAFAEADLDKSGKVDKKELGFHLKKIAASLGIPQPSAADIATVLASFDADGDGKLDRQEFEGLTRMMIENMLE